LGQEYRSQLGFEPEAVHIWACEEQGAQAIAHLTITGHTASQARSYKDAVTVRRDGETWGVAIPAHFGQAR
jgi:hypothetical protein